MNLILAAIVALLTRIPDTVANYVYPRFVKPMIGSLDNAIVRAIGADLEAGFTNLGEPAPDAPDGPVEAFRAIVADLLTIFGFQLTSEQLAPFLVELGRKVLADPDFAEPPAT